MNANQANALWLDLLSAAPRADAVDITSPADSEVTLRNPEFRGTGDDKAEVIVRDANGTELCRGTVVDGEWDCTTTVNLHDGPVDATATQTASDNSTSTDTVSIVVADPLNTPAIAPAIAGGAVFALIALGSAGLLVRRVRAAN